MGTSESREERENARHIWVAAFLLLPHRYSSPFLKWSSLGNKDKDKTKHVKALSSSASDACHVRTENLLHVIQLKMGTANYSIFPKRTYITLTTFLIYTIFVTTTKFGY